MAFTPEDGTGLPNSNSYSDIAYADGYFSDRMVAAWSSLTTDAKQAALIAATDYIDKRWGAYFKGCPATDTQALEFPRDAFKDADGDTYLPEVLKKATAEYALRASSAPLAPDIEQDPSGFQVSRRMEKIGPIEERTDFAFLGPGAIRQLLTPYPAADMLIRTLLKHTQGKVIRN